MQVDYDDYLAALNKERKHGAQRARRQGSRLPVAPLAGGGRRFDRTSEEVTA
jgi:hypothetical protein